MKPTQAAAPPAPPARTIGFAEVQEQGLLVVGDDVYDISRFAKFHPGGEEITALCGSDATLPLINAHGIQGQLPKLPKKLRVGQIDERTLEPLDRQLRTMWRDFAERGLFAYRPLWLVIDFVRAFGLWTLGFLLMPYSAVASFAVFVVARLNVIWWVHDVCHDSVFADRKRARFWAESASLFFVGTPVLHYQYVVHRIHHGFTNVLDADQALDTGPVIWHRRMMERSSRRFVRLQAWFWFLIVLPFTMPFFLVSALVGQAKVRDFFKLGLVAFRWALAYVIFADHLLLLFLPVMAAGYLLSLTASLNHFHRPMTDTLDPNFARSVTRATQNLRENGRLARWGTGGLNFHIEHHFFATMPRRNYSRIAPEVRAFCERNGLPYNTCTMFEAVAALWRKLRNPFPATPSMPAIRS